MRVHRAWCIIIIVRDIDLQRLSPNVGHCRVRVRPREHFLRSQVFVPFSCLLCGSMRNIYFSGHDIYKRADSNCQSEYLERNKNMPEPVCDLCCTLYETSQKHIEIIRKLLFQSLAMTFRMKKTHAEQRTLLVNRRR